jgi:hypothetical protein
VTEAGLQIMVPRHKPKDEHMNDTQSPKIDKTVTGNFFEDFTLGQEIVHATPRTVTVGDVSLFTAGALLCSLGDGQ